MQDVHVKLNPGLTWQKRHSKSRLCHQKIALELQAETSKMLPLEHSFMWNETWTLQKIDQKYLCGAGE